MNNHRDKAVELLTHYLQLAAGIRFSSDSRSEIESIVDEIIAASRSDKGSADA